MSTYSDWLTAVNMHVHREHLHCNQPSCDYHAFYLQYDVARGDITHNKWKIYHCDYIDCEGEMVPLTKEQKQELGEE